MVNDPTIEFASWVIILALAGLAALGLYEVLRIKSERSKCEHLGGVYVSSLCLRVETIDLEN